MEFFLYMTCKYGSLRQGEMLLECYPSTYLESTPRLLVRAAGSARLYVLLQLLARHGRRVTPAVRARHGKPAALGEVCLQRVGHKLLAAVAARHQPLAALGRLVLAPVPALHLHAALVLAVKRLEVAAAHVVLQRVPQVFVSSFETVYVEISTLM